MLSKVIRRFDLFSALPTFRVKGEAEVASICGGILSIIIIITFVQIFIFNLVKIFKLEEIETKQLSQKDMPEDEVLENITIAVGLFQLKVIELGRYFTVRGRVRNQSQVWNDIEMRACLREDWPLIEESVYDKYFLSTCYCPNNKSDLAFSGFFSSRDFSLLNIYISQCDNNTSEEPCASQEEIDQFFLNNSQFNSYIVGKILIMDTAFSPNQQNPVKFYISEDFIWIPLSKKLGNEVVIKLGKWTIITDTSFMPLEHKQVSTGYFIDTFISYNVYREQPTNFYLNALFFNSRATRHFERTYGKVDDLISYMGGLFEFFIIFFSFFMLSYNEYCYQLWVSEGSFTFKKRKRVHEKSFNFRRYLKYSLYDWIKTLCCMELKWEDCQSIDQMREEAIQQIQIQHLLRRISHLETVIKTLITQEDNQVIKLVESESFQEIKKNRRILGYHNLVTKRKTQMTISSARIVDQMLAFGNENKVLRPFTGFANATQKNETCNMEINLQEFQKDEDLTSLQLMNKYLGISDKYRTDISLQVDDLELEDEITDSFYKMQQEKRMKVIEHIPLVILFRLRENKHKNIDKNYPGKGKKQDEDSTIKKFQLFRTEDEFYQKKQ